MTWQRTDPREQIYKRGLIVILRPSTTGRGYESGVGEVETKNGYYVFTPFEGHTLIDEGDKWDELWLWCRGPTKEETGEAILDELAAEAQKHKLGYLALVAAHRGVPTHIPV